MLSDLSLLDLGDQLGEGGLGLALGSLEASGDKPGAAVLASGEDPEPSAVVASLLDFAPHGVLLCGVAKKLPKPGHQPTGSEQTSRSRPHGGMREWPNRTVSKTVEGSRPPWVQIPLPPLLLTAA